MAISFQNYPSSNRVPGQYFEIDATNANTGTVNQRTLLVGQMLATGNAVAGTPVMISSYAQARTAFGPGSMASLMVQQYRKSDIFGELYVMPVADSGAGTQATITVTVTAAATAAGTISLYVAGNLIQVAVSAGNTTAQIATAINAAINAAVDLPCTSSVATAVVTITARHKGIVGGDIDVRVNYGGPNAGEVLPAGVALTIGALTAGTGEPTLSFAGLGDTAYDYIGIPYNDTTSLGAVSALLNDTTGRWSWSVKLFGMAFGAKKGTVSALATYGVALNDQHISVLGVNDTPSPTYIVAADYTAVCANSLRVDPALPLQNIGMNFLAPPKGSRFLVTERNTLYYDGISCVRANDANQVILDRAVTTYQRNTANSPDNSYLDVETLACLQFLIRDLDALMGTRFARKKLVADGTLIPGGSNMVTPQLVRAEVIAWYRRQGANGIVQNIDTFTRNARAENAGNGRVSLLLPLEVANQLRQISTSVQFVKS